MKSHRFLKIAALVLVLLVGFRLYLPTLAKKYLNRQLNQDPVYQGSVEAVQLHLWRGAYTIVRLRMERVHGQKHFPFVSAEKIHIGLAWKELIHRSVAADIDIEGLEVNLVAEPEKKVEPSDEDASNDKKVAIGSSSKKKRKEEAETWQQVFENLVPLNVGNLTVRGNSIHFRDLTADPKVDMYLDQLRIDGQNLTNNRRMSGSLFGSVKMHARMMKSGDMDMELSINPIASPPQFKFVLKIQKLNLVELNPFFTAYGKFDVKKGAFSLYAEGASAEKKVLGYLKPTMEDLEVSDLKKDLKKGGILHAIWEKIVGAIGAIFKNHPADRQAAKIPFSGDLSSPSFDIGTMLMSVLENVFLTPISPTRDEKIQLKDVKKQK